MRALVGGVVLIGIGLLFHDSIVLGDFTLRAIVFDALGVFFIIYGAVAIYRAKRGPPKP